MKIGIVGLGRMGEAIAQRLVDAGHEVFGYDPNEHAQQEAQRSGVVIVATLAELAEKVRIVWLMVSATVVDAVLSQVQPHLKSGDIIIDGGNSNYADSVARYTMLKKLGISFLDCGTSGGVQGRALGFCLMVGGDQDTYTEVHPLLEAIAMPGGVGYMGPAGAGHYVKMVHNGIEYAILEAYGEGFQLIKEGTYKKSTIDLEEVSRVWNNGSVIRSWLLQLAHGIFQRDQEFSDVSGEVAQGGTGAWTVADAYKNKIPVPCIEESLKVREWSEKTGGNYATKLIALLRHAFGEHPVKKVKE